MNSITPIHLSPPNNTILGGRNNTINGNFNAILGGSDNVINGFNHVGMFGHNVIAVRDEAFHANNYLIRDIGIVAGVAGLLWYDSISCAVNIS